MKTQEEIEQLAKQLCNIPIDLVIDEEERYYKNLDKYDGIIQGYTQCQKDMADKRYTEEDLRQAITFGKGMELWKEEKQIEDFINSLNKQDNEQLCECSSKILPNGKIQLHLCKKCNEELFKES